ncbi:MAG: SDR family NAD(P)-dependent oxidoreductase, partial [Mucilaginibacter sp.]
MNSTPSLSGQAALVTGADSGIGKGVAKALAQAGASVVI